MIESLRAGRAARAFAMSALIFTCCSAVGMQVGSLLPCRRVTKFVARSESWSITVVLMPT